MVQPNSHFYFESVSRFHTIVIWPHNHILIVCWAHHINNIFFVDQSSVVLFVVHSYIHSFIIIIIIIFIIHLWIHFTFSSKHTHTHRKFHSIKKFIQKKNVWKKGRLSYQTDTSVQLWLLPLYQLQFLVPSSFYTFRLLQKFMDNRSTLQIVVCWLVTLFMCDLVYFVVFPSFTDSHNHDHDYRLLLLSITQCS